MFLNSDGNIFLNDRWELSKHAHSSTTRNVDEFEERTLTYTRSGRWSFSGLKEGFSEDEEGMENDEFYNSYLEIVLLHIDVHFI